ncbi:MAG: efflux RND transporter periplasmic adaptor subunit [Lentisphaerota bacterium]
MQSLNLSHKFNLLLLSIILIISINGCGPRKPSPTARTPEVAVITIKKEIVVISTELPGRTSAYLTAEVRPQIGGIIQKRIFEEGAEVRTGDLLYQIDPAPYQAIYDKSKAEFEMAEARIVPIKYKFERNKTLIKTHSISQQDFEISEADLYTAQADIQAAKAAVEIAKINLDYTNLKAPITGRIGRSDVTVGALVTMNNPTPLATIQQINPIFVDVVQSSADLLHFKQDIAEGFIKKLDEKKLKAKLFFEDGSLYPLEGEMKFRDISVDQGTGSFIMRIVFPNSEYALLPGMYVRVMIEIGTVENAILVPHQSVSRDMKGLPIAFVVDSSDKVEERSLVIDRSMGDKWLVKEGLKTGDRLIMEGFQRMRPGNIVKVVDFKPSAAKNGAEVDQNISSDNKKK